MILLIGASASGKTEIAHRLSSAYGIAKAITHTSRPLRKGEKNGVDYFFVSDEEFLKLKEKDSFVETTFYNGHYYGCSKAQVADDRCIVLDPNGLVSFLKLGDSHIIPFYLHASEQTRRYRMKIRGDKDENIESRIQNDRLAFSKEKIAKEAIAIDTENKTIPELAETIFLIYKEELAKRG